MSEGFWNKRLYPQESTLPKFIVVVGCDTFGNKTEYKYIHEKEVRNILSRLQTDIDNSCTNFGLDEGGDTE